MSRNTTGLGASGQLTDSGALGTRKRLRHDPDSPSHSTATANTWTDSPLGFSRLSNARSPPPLANDRYELAGGSMGGMDNRWRHNGDYDDYFQLEKQRGTWATPTSPPFGLQNQTGGDTDMMRSTPDKPWMFTQILNLVGGVAGKLVQFCAVPFRGFQAGGGQAYTFDGEVAARLGLQDVDDHAAGVQQPHPGDFPEDNYGVLSLDSVDQEHERPRTAKRLKTGESWVVVDKDEGTESRPCTPRFSERKQARTSSIPRPLFRTSPAVTPKRPSLIPISRRSTLENTSSQGASKAPTTTCATPRSYSRQSYGSPSMVENKARRSPFPPDSQRLINKIRREEMEEDARLRRMSSQMTDLLREAREALGSKIEVEYDNMDSTGMDGGDFTGKSW
ncbi:hypothetical protein K504DRAFT_471657 [Pleomassaria siparia CBS 279.74]|uniref:Uncharacterized protein n=1 Tax=Pleomassaria siparia CBS 279.74 TaxID=1314801 RepID=A0A6G1JZK5_9PLEO|nr:hypothetical protein K504DRAFT_471657 [Pleomassaria siparia CBS 279.74]